VVLEIVCESKFSLDADTPPHTSDLTDKPDLTQDRSGTHGQKKQTKELCMILV